MGQTARPASWGNTHRRQALVSAWAGQAGGVGVGCICTKEPNGTYIFWCGDGIDESLQCHEPECQLMAEIMCDYPMGEGKSCDIPLCREHAFHLGQGFHLCPFHKRLFQSKEKLVMFRNEED